MHTSDSKPKSEYALSSKHDLGKRAFQVQASDARTVWSTERLLERDEIIEVISELATQSSYTIHQPTRGWYLLLKSTDKAFLAAQPYVNLVPTRSADQTFRFSVKSTLPSTKPMQDGSAGGEQLSTSSFTIKPHTHGQGAGNRLSLRALKESFASKRNSFSAFWDDHGQERLILHYEDHPSLLGTDSRGTLALDDVSIASLNIDKTFFIAVSIAYLGFLEDQEAYNAASHG